MDEVEAEPYEILWRTNVGSHMWRMQHPGSDLDIYEAVCVPTRDILIGKAKTGFPNRTLSDGSLVYDYQTHEIGTVVRQILAGNVNHLWGVFSPIVLHGVADLSSLRACALLNLSRRAYYSIRGLAHHNLEKYILSGKDVSAKRLNIIARTVKMGITLLRRGIVEFKATDVADVEEIKSLMTELEEAFLSSTLPDSPTDPEVLEQWLFEVRMRELGRRHPYIVAAASSRPDETQSHGEAK